MKPIGISDSFGGVSVVPKACPTCGSTASVNGGDCLSCLLQAGLEPGEDNGEEFEAVLAEVDVPDTEWRLGNYQILAEIGRGGMGVIYRARQRHSRRIVALKRVLSYHGDSRETLERFRREAQAAASLDHPNILPIYEVGEADGLPFFTMKLAIGGSLQHAAATLRESARDCVGLVAKVARAVDYAHQQGVLHRDLKPGNILLDWRGEPMVSDFGLAKWVDTDSQLTCSLAIFGTPGFIAPEQARGVRGELTAAADIYSLGAILFDLLTGQAPFTGEHALAVIHQAAEKPAPKLRTLLKTADRDLETICAKCLEREPPARYRSAAALADDLERWLEGRAILARPVSPPVRLWRWSRRKPAIAMTAAACMLIAGLAVTRQLQSWRWESEVTAQLAAQRSVQISPILDLDTALPDMALTGRIAAELEQSLALLGPASVTTAAATAPPRQSPGSPRPRQHHPATRALVAGTVRMVDGTRRISLHLLESNERQPLLHRVILRDDPAAAGVLDTNVAQEIYTLLSTADLESVVQRSSDPGLLDPESRNLIEAGLELAKRRGGVDLARSIGCLEQAVKLQPESSAAHAALSRTLAQSASYGSTRAPLGRALESATRAVALEPQSAEAHLALAAVFFNLDRLKESLAQALTSLEYGPPSARAGLVANIYKAIGRPDLALRWQTITAQLASHAGNVEAAKADCYAQLLDDDRAQAGYERYLRLHPEQPEGWMGIARLHLLRGRPAEARATYQQYWKGYTEFSYAAQMAAQVEFFTRNFPEAERIYRELSAHDGGGGGLFYGSVSYASALGRILLESDPAAARQILEHAREVEMQALTAPAEQPSGAYRLAAIEACLGRSAEALEYLRTAAENGWIDYRSLHLDPRFDSIRDTAGYREITAALEGRVVALREQALASLQPPNPTVTQD